MPKAGDDVVICIGRETIEALGNGGSPVKVGENEYLLKADSYDYPYRRIAELEEALREIAAEVKDAHDGSCIFAVREICAKALKR